ncbi:MAG: carbohydrate-binding domain-containing protein [Erysipelotrichales bacterium]|nr:carbohydrate-binding domain-containing protein [Erysipelotrichales bacterium]
MKKFLSLILFGLVLTGCGNGVSSSASVSENSQNSIEQNPNSTSKEEPSVTPQLVDLDKLKEQYGTFDVTTEKGNPGVLSSDGKTYTISVSSSKSAYSISGYFEGQIIINNDSDLSSIKGVELTLNNACIVSQNGPTISYQVDDKNVEIVAKKNTENYIINLGEGNDDSAVDSEKNIELDGKGVLNIITKTGHALKAKKKIRFYDNFTLNIVSGHDAIHANEFIANNEEGSPEDYEEFIGTLNVLSAVSQAFDCTTSSGTGYVDLSSGTYNISNCESVFKTDYSLVIGGQVVATNLTGEPVVRGDNSNGISIEITDTGSFTVDGVNYTKTNI